MAVSFRSRFSGSRFRNWWFRFFGTPVPVFNTITVDTAPSLDAGYVGDVIGTLFNSGAYSSAGGTVIEAAVRYYVDGGLVASSFVIPPSAEVLSFEVDLQAPSSTPLTHDGDTYSVQNSAPTLTGNSLLFKVPAGAVPVLSNPVDAANGQTAATGSVDTDVANGTLHWVATRSGNTPSDDQIVAATDENDDPADASGAQAVTAPGTQPLNPPATGLTAGTGYFTHFCHVTAGGIPSVPVSASGFTTASAGGALSGFAAAQEVIKTTSTASVRNGGVVTGVTAGQRVLITIFAQADSAGLDTSAWTVALGGAPMTRVVGSAASATQARVHLAMFEVVAASSGDLGLAVNTISNHRAIGIYAQLIAGENTSTPFPTSGHAEDPNNNLMNSLPVAVAPAQAGNAMVAAIVIKGGDVTGLGQTGFTTIFTDETSSDPFSDIEIGMAYYLAPDTSPATCAWTWATAADDSSVVFVEIAKA